MSLARNYTNLGRLCHRDVDRIVAADEKVLKIIEWGILVVSLLYLGDLVRLELK